MERGGRGWGRFVLPAAALLVAAGRGPAHAELCGEDGPLVEPGSRVVVTLGKAGDTITGELTGCEGTTAIVEHDVLGRLELAADSIKGTRTVVAACAAGEDVELGAMLAVRLAETGDILTGEYKGCDGEVLVFEESSLGELRLGTDAVASVAVIPVGQPAIAGTALPALETPPPPLWKREVSLGFDGATGNTDRSALRFEVRGVRDNAKGALQMLANFRWATDSGDTSEQRGTALARYNWKFAEPWSLFSQVRFDYDKFKNYDWRWSFTAGPAYRFIKGPPTGWLGRIGAGASQDVGGYVEVPLVPPDPADPGATMKEPFQDGVRPELNVGTDFDHAFSDRQKLVITVDLYPELSALGEYRVIGRAEWSLSLAKKWNLDLRLGLEDRYDSDVSPGTKNNDLEYYGALVKTW